MSVGAIQTNPHFLKVLNAQNAAQGEVAGAESLQIGEQGEQFIEGAEIDGKMAFELQNMPSQNIALDPENNNQLDFAKLLEGMNREENSEEILQPNAEKSVMPKSGFFVHAKKIEADNSSSLPKNDLDQKLNIDEKVIERRPFFAASKVNLPVKDMSLENLEIFEAKNIDGSEAPKIFEGHKGNFVGVNQKKIGANIYLKNAEDINNIASVNDNSAELTGDTIQLPQRRSIPGAYKTETPFIQMKKDNLFEKSNGESRVDNNLFVSKNLDTNAIPNGQMQNYKLDQMNAPLLRKSDNAEKVLDLSNIAKGDVNQIINRIASYIESNKIEAKNGIDLTVKHQDIGEFKIHAQRSGDRGIVDLEITGKGIEAHRFFSQHEDKLVSALDLAGVKIGEFKLTGPSQIGSSLNDNFLMGSSTNSNSNSHSFTQNDERSNNGQLMNRNSFSSQNGGEKRRDLWKQAEDQYREFRNKAA